MRYAVNANPTWWSEASADLRSVVAEMLRTEATPGARAICPSCSAPVLAKCGAVVAWHWSHIGDRDCDPWSEEPSPWHRRWQEIVPPSWREVALGPHRADIRSPDGTVVELQHSYLPADQIAAREAFYPRLLWIFDAVDAYKSGRLTLRDRGDHVSFRWKHPRKSIALCRKPVVLDLGDGQLLRVRRIYPEGRCGGWGYRASVADVVNLLYGAVQQVPA